MKVTKKEVVVRVIHCITITLLVISPIPFSEEILNDTSIAYAQTTPTRAMCDVSEDDAADTVYRIPCDLLSNDCRTFGLHVEYCDQQQDLQAIEIAKSGGTFPPLGQSIPARTGNCSIKISPPSAPDEFVTVPCGQITQECQNDVTKCTGEELDAIENVRANAGITCNNLSDIGLTCLWRWFAVGVGTLSLFLTSWILALMGVLFDYALKYTVMDFAGAVTDVESGIAIAWTASRDLANILIIGMFTFVAISIILGLSSFNAKKHVARVIIIAILINFSYIFSTIIVDVANFVAFQFYTTTQIAAQGVGTTVTQTTSESDITVGLPQEGVAGFYMQLLGVTTVSGAWDKLLDVSNATDAGFPVLLQGLFAGTVFLITAILFGYGAILLLIRVLFLVFLFVTSALAFAAYLIPKWGDQYWNMWWGALLRNAAFAPLLTFSLWISLTISQTFAAQTKGGLLGSLVDDPSQANNVKVLFGFFLIAGLLYGAIRLASSLASSIPGFNPVQSFGQMVAGTGLLAGGTLAGRGVGALSRFGLGGAGALSAGALKDAQDRFIAWQTLNKAKGNYFKAFLNRLPINLAGAGAKIAEGASKSTFDPNRSWLGRTMGGLVRKNLGARKMPGIIAGTAPKSFHALEKAEGNRITEAGGRQAKVTKAMEEEVEKQARQEASKETKELETTKGQTREELMKMMRQQIQGPEKNLLNQNTYRDLQKELGQNEGAAVDLKNELRKLNQGFENLRGADLVTRGAEIQHVMEKQTINNVAITTTTDKINTLLLEVKDRLPADNRDNFEKLVFRLGKIKERIDLLESPGYVEGEKKRFENTLKRFVATNMARQLFPVTMGLRGNEAREQAIQKTLGLLGGQLNVNVGAERQLKRDKVRAAARKAAAKERAEMGESGKEKEAKEDSEEGEGGKAEKGKNT